MTRRGKHITVHIRKYLFRKKKKNIIKKLSIWKLIFIAFTHPTYTVRYSHGQMWKNSYCCWTLTQIFIECYWHYWHCRLFIERFSHFFIWLIFLFVVWFSSLFFVCLIITWTWKTFYIRIHMYAFFLARLFKVQLL